MSTAAAPDPIKQLRAGGWMLIVTGLISIVAGILALVYPGITLLALAIFAGINIILFSIVRMVDAFSDELDTSGRVLSAVIGVLGLIAGLVILRRPGESLLALLLVIGIWFIVSGFIDFFAALALREDRGLRMLGAIADIVLGVLILSLPELSLVTLAVFVGIGFILRGVLAIYAGWHLRKLGAAPARPAPA